MSEFYNNSIFWVEVDRISPNPYQPRKEFNDDKIAELADSIRQYGVLQPLVVTRKETERPDGGITVEYELIAGERRLRASKLAMLPQVPVIIRAQEETNKMKLELAIIENLQREDLNAMDRARAFKQLVDEFNLKHIEIAKKVGKSREYVSNTLRLLGLPEHIQNALTAREISEGHARPLLMLGERPQERDTLFKEITSKRLTVRESERIARRIATDKARKQDLSPELIGIEKELTETLGTRVQIEKRSEKGGKVHIDYFGEEDLKRLLDMLAKHESAHTASPVALAAPAVVAAAAAPMADEAVQHFNNNFSPIPETLVELEPEPVATSIQAQAPEPEPQTAQPAEPFNPFALNTNQEGGVVPQSIPDAPAEQQTPQAVVADPFADLEESIAQAPVNPFSVPTQTPETTQVQQAQAITQEETQENKSADYDDDDLYSIKNFSI